MFYSAYIQVEMFIEIYGYLLKCGMCECYSELSTQASAK